MSNAQFNPEMQAKWLAALESGDYKQGRNALRNNKDEFCCLGVACDVHNIPCKLEDGIYYYEFSAGINLMGSLADPIAQQLGIEHIQGKLTEMNDIGKSFKEIADYVREYNASIGR